MKTVNSPDQTFARQLEDLTQCEDHLQFVTRLLQRSQIAPSVRLELEQQIDHIRQRYQDSNLYLAVVGEFSSGKSTFINALLRDDLLEASVAPTTATATKIRYGRQLSTEVEIKGDRSGVLRTQPESQHITIPWLGISRMDNRQFIRTVTSQDKIAQQISAVTVSHPAHFLSNGIVIIDTPGINANSIHAQHGNVTQQAVDTLADAAVIVIPATTPLSQSLTQFLASTLQHCLHRCIFVVTKMDAIRLRDQDRVVNHIKTRLAADLDLADPMVIAASPQIVIDHLNGEDISSSLQHWQDQFAQLEGTLQKRLQQERVLSIAERLIRLLTQLLNQLSASIKAEWNCYQTKQAMIESEVIQDLRSFTLEQYRTCDRTLKSKAASIQMQLERCVGQHRDRVIQSIQTEFSAARDNATLETVLRNRVKLILEADQKSLHSDLQQQFGQLSQAAIQIGATFDLQFSEMYQQLKALGGNINIQSVRTAQLCQIDPVDATSAVKSLQQQFTQSDEASAGRGAIAGAAIGTFLIPGVGTVIGAAIGAVLPSLFISFEQRKTQIWQTLQASLNQQYSRSETQIQASLQEAIKTLELAMRQRIDAYSTAYQNIIDQMLSDQQTELQHLNQLQAMLQLDLSNLQQRRELLETQQKHLEKMSNCQP